MTTNDLIISFLVNIVYSLLVGTAYAVVLYAMGRMLQKPEQGKARAKALVVLVTFLGTFLGWRAGISIGFVAVIVFAVGLMLSTRKSTDINQT